ncbi:DUF421 domain-containing protein [Plantactinospora sp. BB1]|uniref:DUF421 domain-containing protein n=1 Tax=Plantactinospora sp. BB1 TaxID=2071627 RepID=UPI000D15DD06|nr:YetF domain-containing protein [Plantactinospora sp. BB1]AVT38056.1 hypothetical protein C6W10_18220 [Plantactinospora sp. BB1]
MDWQSIFAPSVPVLEGIVRGTVTFLVLLFLMRLVGQRESGGLGLTDVLLVVLVAQAAAVGLHGEAESVTDGVVVVATILFWSVTVDALAYRFPRGARLLKARPKALIEDGKLNRRVMLREFMTVEEVHSQLRLHGIEEIDVVDRAYIEPNGMISVIRRDHAETDPVEPPEIR